MLSTEGKTFRSTFFVFNDYLLVHRFDWLNCKIYLLLRIYTDSDCCGEDGPTHEPIEQLAALRAIPGLTVIRPSDANETASAWAYALQQTDGPVVLVLSRQIYRCLLKRKRT
ncbi:hypothetical protein ACT7DF_11120 [Bacillus cereus]